MLSKFKMRKALKGAKLELIKHNAINSPVYLIKTTDRVVAHQPAWGDYETKTQAMNELKRICTDLEATEVMSISDTLLRNLKSDIPFSDAICVSLENKNCLKLVILPYSRTSKNKFLFGDEIWESRKYKIEDALAEGLIQ